MQILACDVDKDLAYIAINNGEILVFSIFENKTVISFRAWQDEEVIFLKGIKTNQNNYLLVVYRSAALVYQIHRERVERLCSYILNSRKTPNYKDGNSFSSHLRFYFTSAKV